MIFFPTLFSLDFLILTFNWFNFLKITFEIVLELFCHFKVINELLFNVNRLKVFFFRF